MASLFGGGGEGGGIGGLLGGIGGGGGGGETPAVEGEIPGYKDVSQDWTALGEYMSTPGFQNASRRNRAGADRAAQSSMGPIQGYQNVSQVQRHTPGSGLLNNTNVGMSQQGNGLQGLLAMMNQARR